MPGFAEKPGYAYVQINDLGLMCFSGTNINAHCAEHTRLGAKCHCDRLRTAAVRCGVRDGQGRPLGLLMLWLSLAKDWPDSHSARHCKIKLGSPEFHGQRVAARARLRQIPGSGPLFDAERPLRAGEDEAPMTVPG